MRERRESEGGGRSLDCSQTKVLEVQRECSNGKRQSDAACT